jgi:carbamoyl-phosphate synthase large subunit
MTSVGPAVLFTSAGRRVSLLTLFHRAYDSLGLQSRVLATDTDPLAPSLQVADQPFLMPRLTDPAYIPALLEVCRSEGVTMILPLIDPDIPVLALHRQEIEATGARVATVSVVGTEITADKWRTREFFTELGLASPRSWLPHELDPNTAEYPLFIKPRRGSAGQGAFPIHNAGELRFFLGYVPDPVVQELLPGPEVTCDVVCDLEGSVLAVVARRRIEVRGGEVSKGITVKDEALFDACVRIAESLRARGPITVQCIMKDGEPYFTEVNARLGGGFPLGVAAGADSPRWLLARAAGLQVEVPPIGNYEVGLAMTRFDDGYFLSERDREQISSHRL